MKKNFLKKNIQKKIPKQITFIPMINYSEIPKYYKFADAVIGNMFIGNHELVTLEGVLCKKPVLSYTDPNIPIVADGKEIPSPFLPTSKDPKKIAEIIDLIVSSSKKRDDLFKKQYEFVSEMTDPKKCGKWWDELFEKTISKTRTIHKNSSKLSINFRIFLFLVGNRLYTKKLKKLFKI